YRRQSPGRVLDALWQLLKVRWPDAYRDGMAVVIPFGSDEGIMSVDVVPAFHRSEGGYHIPDAGAGTWLPTNPEKHGAASTKKAAAAVSLREALAIAASALDPKDDEQERAAVEQWRKLLGNRMPRP